MIDLSRVKGLLDGEVAELIHTLNGVDLDDVQAIENQTKSKARTFRAEKSKELLLLADRLELASNLVRNEYWFAKGEDDPLSSGRDV